MVGRTAPPDRFNGRNEDKLWAHEVAGGVSPGDSDDWVEKSPVPHSGRGSGWISTLSSKLFAKRGNLKHRNPDHHRKQ